MVENCCICQSKWCPEVVFTDEIRTDIHKGHLDLKFTQTSHNAEYDGKEVGFSGPLCDLCLEDVLEGLRKRSPEVPYKGQGGKS